MHLLSGSANKARTVNTMNNTTCSISRKMTNATYTQRMVYSLASNTLQPPASNNAIPIPTLTTERGKRGGEEKGERG